MSELKRVSFWRWLASGAGDRPGWQNLVDGWLVFHLGGGFLLSSIVPMPLHDAAGAVLLPLAGILIGMTFAWAVNAQTLLQTPEIERLSTHHPGGFEDYVYAFQLSILILFATLALWGLAGMGVFEAPCLWNCPTYSITVARTLLFAAASMALRECWHVVVGAHEMLIHRKRIRDVEAQNEKGP